MKLLEGFKRKKVVVRPLKGFKRKKKIHALLVLIEEVESKKTT